MIIIYVLLHFYPHVVRAHVT